MTRFAHFAVLALALALSACRGKGQSDQKPDVGPPPGVLYPTGDFSFTDQSGNSFGSKELRGKPYVAAFFFTRCPTVCPRLIARIKSIQTEAKKRNLSVGFVTITVDPDNDTPEVFRSYAHKNDLDLASWHLLTGDAESIKKRALEGFKIAVEGKADANAPDFGLLHGTHLILVDKDGQIRGYYGSNDDAAAERLLADIPRL